MILWKERMDPTTLSPYFHKHLLRHTHAHHNHTHANKVKFLKVVGEGVAVSANHAPVVPAHIAQLCIFRSAP